MEEEKNKICYHELKEKGGCWRRENCKFSHVISQEVLEQKDEILSSYNKNNLCVNEFRNVGGCRKGVTCKFNHNITDNQRNDPVIMEIMKKRQTRILTKKIDQENGGEYSHLCVYEFRRDGECRRGSTCRYSHVISPEQRLDSTVKEEIKKRTQEIHKRNVNTRSEWGGRDTNQDIIPVPKKMLEQIYSLLGANGLKNHF